MGVVFAPPLLLHGDEDPSLTFAVRLSLCASGVENAVAMLLYNSVMAR